jgi:hypothetical protein
MNISSNRSNTEKAKDAICELETKYSQYSRFQLCMLIENQNEEIDDLRYMITRLTQNYQQKLKAKDEPDQ